MLTLPAPAPYLPLPTLAKGKVRDISLTDFKGSYVAVFFCASDFENHDDLTILNQHLKVFKKQSCDVVACSTDSTMLHSKWIQSLKDEDEGTKAEDFHIPLMSDKTGELSKKFGLFDDEERVCLRSFLILDDKSVCREAVVSSLEMADMVTSVLDTVAAYRSIKLEEVTGGGSGILDRIWRTTLKLPETPQRSMARGARSSSRAKSPGADKSAARSRSAAAKGKSRERSVPGAAAGSQADEFAENIVKSLKVCMSSLYSEAELPGLSAGEIRLKGGRVSGLWKVSRGGLAEQLCTDQQMQLSFPLLLRGVACAYDFSGRRLHGEVSCSYERLVYRVTVRQAVTPECFTRSLQLAGLALKEVKGVRMNVSGFGPLNWIAGKSVTNVIQETVLQVVEDQLRAGTLLAINNASFYFQMKPTESHGLSPAGILVC